MVGSSPTLLFSSYFDAVNLNAAAVFHFPVGLPGFETEHRFAAVQIPGQHPLLYLQSAANPALCLMTLPVQTLAPNLDLQITSEDRDLLEMEPDAPLHIGQNVLGLAILAAELDGSITANLLAPLIVNLSNLRAVQSIQPDSSLSCTYLLSPAAAAC